MFPDASDAVVILEALHRIEQSAKVPGAMLNTPQLVKQYFRIMLGNKEREYFAVAFFDVHHRLIDTCCLFQGTLTQTSVYPREVVRAALKRNAHSVIFAHNHPSGVALPSKQDWKLTRRLAEAAALVDVIVTDHIVVTAGEARSMLEHTDWLKEMVMKND